MMLKILCLLLTVAVVFSAPFGPGSNGGGLFGGPGWNGGYDSIGGPGANNHHGFGGPGWNGGEYDPRENEGRWGQGRRQQTYFK